MRWSNRKIRRNRKQLNKIKQQAEWHNWFAWYPVPCACANPMDPKIVWLETVKRKVIRTERRRETLFRPYARLIVYLYEVQHEQSDSSSDVVEER